MTELRHLQLVILDIMKDIDKLCRVHNIEYYLLGGSAIGAIRHKGFIPWDSDMDFAMKRADFDKFCEVAKIEITEPYFFQCDETDDGYSLAVRPEFAMAGPQAWK